MDLNNVSEHLGVLHAFDLVVVLGAERLVDVVGVGRVLGALDLVRVGFALGQDFSAGTLVLLHHLNRKNVIDLNVMGGDAVVQEAGGEHHVVALEPELRVVLRVEVKSVSPAVKLHSGHQAEPESDPDENGAVVKGAVGDTAESGEHRPALGQELPRFYVNPVDNAQNVARRVGRELTGSHFECSCDSANEAGSLGETFVNQVL